MKNVWGSDTRCLAGSVPGVLVGLLFSAASFADVIEVAVPGDAAGPDEVVAVLEETLIATMADSEALDFPERREALRPVVERALDVGRMSRLMFGRIWTGLPEAEQQRFEEALLELSVANYAHHFVDHRGQQFEQVESVQENDRAQVRSHFQRPDLEPIVFEYTMHQTDAGWQVVNILTDGVSDLAVSRARFTRLFERGGMDAVIEDIEQEIDELGQQ